MLGIKVYIVYSKSAGDNWDLVQAVMLTPGDPPDVFITGVRLYKAHIMKENTFSELLFCSFGPMKAKQAITRLEVRP